MLTQHSEVKALLSAIAFKIPELTTEMTSQELGNALYGLQKMSSDAKEVREVMFALSNQLTRYFNQYDESINAAPRDEDDDDDNGDLKKLLNSNRVSNFSMSPQLISNALYGLQNMSDSMRDTRYVLAAILPAIKNPTEPFSSLAVGLALYGLQSMTANSVEVRRVLDALATQIELCNEPFNAQTLGNALYGLKSMDSDSDEIRRLLSAFSNQLRKNIGNQKLTGQSIGNALYGLKNMQGDVVEVQELVALLADAIKHSDAQLSAQAVGNAIYGLSCMSSNEESVLHLLEALTVKVKSSQGKLNSQAIASALYGLQNMSSTSKQVRQLLLALSIKINECEDPANDRLIGNALYGLKSISLSDGYEVRLIVSALTEYFFCSTKAYRPDGTLIPMLHTSNIFDRKGFKENKMYDIIKSDNVRGVIPLSGKSVGMGLYGLRRMSSNYFEAKNLLAALMPSICATSSGLDGQFIGNSMYGIQNMSCSVSEVRTLLNFMTSKLKSSEVGILSGQELAISLFGCRSMEGCDELKQFLGAISYHLSECTDVLSPLAISECFVGMQNIPFYEEKKFLFAQLSDRIDKCVDPFSIDIIAMACYGFKLHDESFESEIKGILNKFHKVVLENKMVLAPHHCANFLFGLRGCPRSGDGLLSLAFDWILAANKQLTLSDIAADKLLNSYNLDLWRNLNQSVQLYLETDSSLPVDKKNMLEHFCIRLNNLLPVKGNVSEINHVEQNVFSSIKKCMENIQDVHITEHEFLHSFQCDIIVRYANLNGEEIILNVEIDGLTHERSTKRNFCNLRDNFLRKRGIQVLRINFKGRQAKMDLEVKKAIDFVKRSIISSRIR